MHLKQLWLVLMGLVLSGCALLGRPSFEDDVIVRKGESKKYVLILNGKAPNMVHSESNMFWPTYHNVFYKIHVDTLSGIVPNKQFSVTYKNGQGNLDSYSGSLLFEGNELIINLRNCPHPKKCFDADFNGSYQLNKKAIH